MGFFSWKTSDTDKSISNIYSKRKTFPVYVLVPKEFQREFGKYIEEKEYEGYGVFGGHDVYALVAKWNKTNECKKDKKWLPDESIRSIGIDIACYDEQNENLKYPIKIVENKELNYEDVAPSKSCAKQGYFYDENKSIEMNISIDLGEKMIYIGEENSSGCEYDYDTVQDIFKAFESYIYNYVKDRVEINEDLEEEQ